MAELELTIDDARLESAFRQAPELISAGLRRLVEGAAIDLHNQERVAAPVAVTGQLRGSIRYKFMPLSLTAEVGPTVDYAAAIENGTRPHWVSVKPGTPLFRWAKQKGINPFAVQRSIAKKGTKAHPFVMPTFERLAPKIRNDFATGVEALLGGFNA